MLEDGTTTLDQTGPDTTATEEVRDSSPATETAPGDLGQDHEADTGQAPEDDDLDELEYDGEKYRIPKKLKPGFMMQADYTRKTQGLAEDRKALDQERETFSKQAEAFKEINEDRKKLIVIDDWLERQSKQDWQKLWAEDPIDTPRKWAEYQHWKDQRGTLASKIEQHERERSEEAAQSRAKRIQEVREAVSKIPGWSAEADAKAEEYVKSLGVKPEQLEKLILEGGATFVQMVHEARIGRELRQKQQAAAKIQTQPTEPIKPLTNTVTRANSAAVRKDPSKMSTEEYAQWRKNGGGT